MSRHRYELLSWAGEAAAEIFRLGGERPRPVAPEYVGGVSGPEGDLIVSVDLDAALSMPPDELSAAERVRLDVHQHMLARARATAARQPDLVGEMTRFSARQAALAAAYECQGFDDTPSP